MWACHEASLLPLRAAMTGPGEERRQISEFAPPGAEMAESGTRLLAPLHDLFVYNGSGPYARNGVL